jgi:hypothetical protein
MKDKEREEPGKWMWDDSAKIWLPVFEPRRCICENAKEQNGICRGSVACTYKGNRHPDYYRAGGQCARTGVESPKTK